MCGVLYDVIYHHSLWILNIWRRGRLTALFMSYSMPMTSVKENGVWHLAWRKMIFQSNTSHFTFILNNTIINHSYPFFLQNFLRPQRRRWLNQFTPGTFTHDNPPIPWQFLVENKRTRAPKVNHMRSKTRDKLLLSNKLFLFVELMDSQGM